MLIVAFVSFSLFNFVGDPVNNMVGQEASDERREEIRDKLGINDPIYVQFYNFVENIVQGNRDHLIENYEKKLKIYENAINCLQNS